VTGLAHQLGEAGALVAGGEPGAQAVPGIPLRVEPGAARGLLSRRATALSDRISPVARPVLLTAQNSAVEIGGAAPVAEPGVERGKRAEPRLVG
jgi:hypothetical protein